MRLQRLRRHHSAAPKLQCSSLPTSDSENALDEVTHAVAGLLLLGRSEGFQNGLHLRGDRGGIGLPCDKKPRGGFHGVLRHMLAALIKRGDFGWLMSWTVSFTRALPLSSSAHSSVMMSPSAESKAFKSVAILGPASRKPSSVASKLNTGWSEAARWNPWRILRWRCESSQPVLTFASRPSRAADRVVAPQLGRAERPRCNYEFVHRAEETIVHAQPSLGVGDA